MRMSILDEARRLAAKDVVDLVCGCQFCAECVAPNDPTECYEDHVHGGHAPDCAWLAMPRIVAALEQQAEDEANQCMPCMSKVYSGIGTFPWTCKNGHTVYYSGGPLTARHRQRPKGGA